MEQAVADMKNLNNIIEQLQGKIEKLRSEREVLKQKVIILTSENTRIRDESMRSSAEINALRERNQSLVRELLKCDKILYGKK